MATSDSTPSSAYSLDPIHRETFPSFDENMQMRMPTRLVPIVSSLNAIAAARNFLFPIGRFAEFRKIGSKFFNSIIGKNHPILDRDREKKIVMLRLIQPLTDFLLQGFRAPTSALGAKNRITGIGN